MRLDFRSLQHLYITVNYLNLIQNRINSSLNVETVKTQARRSRNVWTSFFRCLASRSKTIKRRGHELVRRSHSMATSQNQFYRYTGSGGIALVNRATQRDPASIKWCCRQEYLGAIWRRFSAVYDTAETLGFASGHISPDVTTCSLQTSLSKGGRRGDLTEVSNGCWNS